MGVLEKLPLAGEPFKLTRRHTHGESGAHARTVQVTLEAQEAGVRVQAHGTPIYVTRPGAIDATSMGLSVERPRILPVHKSPDRSFVIHFGPLDRPHRVATVCGGSQ